MPKSSLEKQLEKNRVEMKRQVEKARKDEKTRLRKEQELAKKEELRQRASAIICRQEIVDGFLIIDNDAEIVLNCLIEHCTNPQNGHVNFENTYFPPQYKRTISLEIEKLVQYGMLTVFAIWGNGGIVNLLPAAFSYQFEKERAMMKKTQNGQPQVENNYYGNTNVISGTVNSSAIVAGGNNTVTLEHEKESTIETIEVGNNDDLSVKKMIFISHRSTDKEVVDMLMDFFLGTGIPRENVFCSSIPGNDVKDRIFHEVKNALKSSAVNIVLLSKDYYESPFCMNEAGIIWFQEGPAVITIALPEITHDKMKGFLNNEHKLRSLNNDVDIAYIYGTIVDRLHIPQANSVVIIEETKKLKQKYEAYLLNTDI